MKKIFSMFLIHPQILQPWHQQIIEAAQMQTARYTAGSFDDNLATDLPFTKKAS
jgi:hypothetical protein